MKCDDLLRLLTDYREGAADECVCREVEEHLSGCPSCETLRQDLERLSHWCRQTPRPRLPDDLRRRILAQIRPTDDTDSGR
jgi:RNA polymerase sigma-70 factor (ECF subfamily)